MGHRILTIFTYIVFEPIIILPTIKFVFSLDCKSIEFAIKIQISLFQLLYAIENSQI